MDLPSRWAIHCLRYTHAFWRTVMTNAAFLILALEGQMQHERQGVWGVCSGLHQRAAASLTLALQTFITHTICAACLDSPRGVFTNERTRNTLHRCVDTLGGLSLSLLAMAESGSCASLFPLSLFSQGKRFSSTDGIFAFSLRVTDVNGDGESNRESAWFCFPSTTAAGFPIATHLSPLP